MLYKTGVLNIRMSNWISRQGFIFWTTYVTGMELRFLALDFSFYPTNLRAMWRSDVNVIPDSPTQSLLVLELCQYHTTWWTCGTTRNTETYMWNVKGGKSNKLQNIHMMSGSTGHEIRNWNSKNSLQNNEVPILLFGGVQGWWDECPLIFRSLVDLLGMHPWLREQPGILVSLCDI